jgi:type 1 glutamine amidotransferase
MPKFRGIGFLACIGLLLAATVALAPAADAPAETAAHAKKKIVFITGKPSHGFAQHEQYAGCMLLAKSLGEGMPDYDTVVYKGAEWPKPDVLDSADAIIIFCDGGAGHLALPHLDELAPLMDKGVGLGCIHYGVEVPKDKGGPELKKWIGGYFETFWSINPTWDAQFSQKSIPDHPVARGVHAFGTHDEWYYHMRFRDDMEGVTPILSAVPPDSTRKGKDDAHGGNPAVRDGIGKEIPETVVWVSTRPTKDDPKGGRGFGCTGAHYHFNWAQDDFRKTILNAIVWVAHGEVPEGGVKSTRPTIDDLLANLDKKPVPPNFDKAAEQKKLDEMNQTPTAQK